MSVLEGGVAVGSILNRSLIKKDLGEHRTEVVTHELISNVLYDEVNDPLRDETSIYLYEEN